MTNILRIVNYYRKFFHFKRRLILYKVQNSREMVFCFWCTTSSISFEAQEDSRTQIFLAKTNIYHGLITGYCLKIQPFHMHKGAGPKQIHNLQKSKSCDTPILRSLGTFLFLCQKRQSWYLRSTISAPTEFLQFFFIFQ